MKADLEKNPQKKKKGSWINIQNILFLVVSLVFFIAIEWSSQISMKVNEWKLQDYSVTPTITSVPIKPTLFPYEWANAPIQTNGVILGGLVIVIIILGSTFAIMISDKKK